MHILAAGKRYDFSALNRASLLDLIELKKQTGLTMSMIGDIYGDIAQRSSEPGYTPMDDDAARVVLRDDEDVRVAEPALPLDGDRRRGRRVELGGHRDDEGLRERGPGLCRGAVLGHADPAQPGVGFSTLLALKAARQDVAAAA